MCDFLAELLGSGGAIIFFSALAGIGMWSVECGGAEGCGATWCLCSEITSSLGPPTLQPPGADFISTFLSLAHPGHGRPYLHAAKPQCFHDCAVPNFSPQQALRETLKAVSRPGCGGKQLILRSVLTLNRTNRP